MSVTEHTAAQVVTTSGNTGPTPAHGDVLSAETTLTKWDRIKADLAEARSVDALKDVRDRASALRLYLQQAGESQAIQNNVAAIKVRAERRIGEMLEAMAENGERAGKGDRRNVASSNICLDDLGISRVQSHRWQRLASIPEPVFEQHVAEHIASDTKELTTKGLLGLSRRTQVERSIQVPEIEACNTDDLKSLVSAGTKFGTIYADPPWNYDNVATRASASGEYVTQTTEWMRDEDNMPIQSLAADESHLHLWTTNAFIFQARELMDAWGFIYKSCFVWVKPQMGIGNYWRVSHEFMLLGVRGGLRFANKALKSWAEIPRGKHSEKPDQVRAMIESASPGPRLELFGRKAVPGWTVWGNEIERNLLSGVQLQ